MTQMIFIILNFATCIPVLLAVGGFRSVRSAYPYGIGIHSFYRSIYHFWMLFGNTTTIEGWEKDKVATLVRRGKIQEVSILIHAKRNTRLSKPPQNRSSSHT